MVTDINMAEMIQIEKILFIGISPLKNIVY